MRIKITGIKEDKKPAGQQLSFRRKLFGGLQNSFLLNDIDGKCKKSKKQESQNPLI
jgi:hypothetical protein